MCRMGCGRGKEMHREVVIGMREKKRKMEIERTDTASPNNRRKKKMKLL